MGPRSKQRQQDSVKSAQRTQQQQLQQAAAATQRISPPPFLQHQSSSSAKFDLEPNPFEQSFNFDGRHNPQLVVNEGGDGKQPHALPPMAAIDTPNNGMNIARNNPLWDSLRSGELSPSMLGGPRPAPAANDTRTSFGPNMLHPQLGHSMAAAAVAVPPPDMTNNHPMNQSSMPNNMSYEPIPAAVQPNNLYLLSAAQQEVMRRGSHDVPTVKAESDDLGYSPPTRRRTTTSPDSSNDDMQPRRTNRRSSSASKRNDGDDSEKRRNFLERNRQAALKCRQRKKQWLADLQNKVEYLSSDNEKLQTQATSLREEIINLKTLLLAHKDCAVAQANGVVGLEQLRAAPGMLLRQNVQTSAPMNMFGGTSNSFQSNVQISSAQNVASRGY